MRHAIQKPHTVPFKIFAARLTELNNYLPSFLGSDRSNNMDTSDINEILLHDDPNGWENQSYLQGWDFESKTYKETCDMFKIMEIVEQVYKGGTPSTTTNRADDSRAGHSRKKGGESA